MLQRKLLFAQLVPLTALLAVVLFGLGHGALWDVAWYSATAHFLGGLWSVFFFVWAQSTFRLRRDLFLCVVATLMLGVCWELFEVLISATDFPVDTIDTITDLVMDVVGGFAGVLVIQNIWPQK